MANKERKETNAELEHEPHRNSSKAVARSSPHTNGILCLPAASSKPPNRTRNMVSLESLANIVDTKRLEVKVVKPDEGDGVANSKSEHKGFDEISALLQGTSVCRLRTVLELDSFRFEVHANVEFELRNDGFVQLHPLRLQGRHAVRRDLDAPILRLEAEV